MPFPRRLIWVLVLRSWSVGSIPTTASDEVIWSGGVWPACSACTLSEESKSLPCSKLNYHYRIIIIQIYCHSFGDQLRFLLPVRGVAAVAVELGDARSDATDDCQLLPGWSTAEDTVGYCRIVDWRLPPTARMVDCRRYSRPKIQSATASRCQDGRLPMIKSATARMVDCRRYSRSKIQSATASRCQFDRLRPSLRKLLKQSSHPLAHSSVSVIMNY